MSWFKELLLVLRNALAIYVILLSSSLIWFSFRKVENPKAYQEFLEHIEKAPLGGLLFYEAQRQYLYLTLPVFCISLALGLRLVKLRPDK